MSTLLWFIFYYTIAVVLFCSLSWKCYKRDGQFLWKGFARDIGAVWIAGAGLIIGCFIEAITETAKGVYQASRWVVRKFKED